MGRLLARVAIGGVFAGHGLQKLVGWFDGPGLDGAAEAMEEAGLRPGRRNAVLAGATETAGGALVALGALTPVAAAGLIGVTLTEMRTSKQRFGEGGLELGAALIAGLLAIVDGGPGRAAIDRKLKLGSTGPLVAVGALGAGAAVSTFLVKQGASAPDPAPAWTPPVPAPASSAAAATDAERIVWAPQPVA